MDLSSKQLELLEELNAALNIRRDDFETEETKLNSVSTESYSKSYSQYYLIDKKLKLKWRIDKYEIALTDPQVIILLPPLFTRRRAVFNRIRKKYQELYNYHETQFLTNVVRDSNFRLETALTKMKKVKPSSK